MSKKVLIILVVLALVAAGGYFAFRAYQDQQARDRYQHSADKIADDFNRYLLASDANGAMNLFTPDLQKSYSADYWQKNLFNLFKGYKGTVQLQSKRSANESGQPPAYSDAVNAQRFVYAYALNGFKYNVALVIVQQDNNWRINELSGAYQQ
jgi:hypothetical protein